MDTLDLSKLKILMVDDYAPMLLLLASMLRELGVKDIHQASTVADAFEKIEKVEPDILITDALMRPVDGFQLTQKIRAGEAGADPFLLVLMVSGMTEMSNIVRARDSGITEFLAKPISANLLYMRICSVISNPRSFVRTSDFFGPDRRRRSVARDGEDRREDEHQYDDNTRKDNS